MNKISNFSNEKAFSLYVWLILFTLIISTVSIVIFNYVAADIKTATNFSKNVKQVIRFDSYAIVSVELYKVNNSREANILSTGYEYSIEPIDSSTLLVNILKNNILRNSDLCARYVVQYSMDLGSINKIVGSSVEFEAGNRYNNTLVAASPLKIEASANKIFNTLIFPPNTEVKVVDEDGEETTINNPNSELLRYANNIITDIDITSLDQTLNRYISEYYKNYYRLLYNRYFDGSTLRDGVALYDDNNIVFTKGGNVIIKSPAEIEIHDLSNEPKFDTYIDIIIDQDTTYRLAISNDLYIRRGNDAVFDYQTGKPLQTNDSTLAANYASNTDCDLRYYDYIAKVIILPNKYISVKTSNTQLIILALDDVRLLSTTDIDKNILIVSKLDKNVTIDLPFRYDDYKTTHKSIPLDSNSLIKVISNNITIDARSYINDTSSNNIDITGIFTAFYNENSTINIINRPNNVNITDVNINVFGSFQSYDSIKINGDYIFNTGSKEFYYSDPRVDKLNDIASLKVYRTQILAKEIIKLPIR
jgi:hypothetical protein